MIKKFRSSLSDQLEYFLQTKINMGRKYKTGIFYLRKIDELAVKYRLRTNRITSEFARDLFKPSENHSDRSRMERIRYVILFSKFLRDQGIDSYVPVVPVGRNSRRFVPHIYDQAQIEKILNACDSLRPQLYSQSFTVIFCVPVIIRLLIATGIRVSEALQLKTSDINFEEKHILIKDVKNGRERILPISTSLGDVLKAHLECIKLFCSKTNQSEYFFINLQGRRISYQGLHRTFLLILRLAEIPFRGDKQGPRLHDFRHTFAVRAVEKMSRQGIDSYTALPIIQNYLGHVEVRSTELYIRLTNTFQSEIVERTRVSSIDVFPKFKVE